MGKLLSQLRILIVDDDDLLRSEADSLGHPAIVFSALSPQQVSASKGSLADRDIVVIGVDTPGGLDLVADLCSRPGMPPVIALAGNAPRGQSLEHVLLLAELRGAALSLPKPIDGVELALAAIELIRARSGSGAMATVTKDLERRLDW
jgi:DNA-binding response OmpR family regulator